MLVLTYTTATICSRVAKMLLTPTLEPVNQGMPFLRLKVLCQISTFATLMFQNVFFKSIKLSLYNTFI